MNDYIGRLVKQFESGNKGSLALSSCGNDWGISCGSYQLTLRWGNCIGFLKKYFPVKAKNLYFNSNKGDITTQSYPGAEYCSNPSDVKAIWTACYNEVGADKFFGYEHEYIKSMYYDQLVAKSPIKPYNRALQESFWAWAIHKGVSGALAGLNKLKDVRSDKLFDAIYDYRYEVNPFARYGKGKDSERETLRPYLKQTLFEEGVCMNEYKKIFTVDEFLKMLNKICNMKTAYVYGCTGEPVTKELIDRKANEQKAWYTPDRVKYLKALDDKGYYGFDCVNLLKALFWGWTGKELTKGNYVNYQSNTIKDINADNMFKLCASQSTDMTKIEVGEAIWFSGHIGVYVGVVNGVKSVIDCTPSINKVCVNVMSRQKWLKHGKLPWVDYSAKESVGKVAMSQVTTSVIRKGDKGESVSCLQERLNASGYNLAIDGSFGAKTDAVVRDYQKKNGLVVDGIVGAKTWGVLVR